VRDETELESSIRMWKREKEREKREKKIKIRR